MKNIKPKLHQIEHVGGVFESSQRADFKTPIGCQIWSRFHMKKGQKLYKLYKELFVNLFVGFKNRNMHNIIIILCKYKEIYRATIKNENKCLIKYWTFAVSFN